MKHSRTLAAAVLLACALLTDAGAPAQTQSGALGITVSPAKLELSAPPGTNYNVPVTISNASGAETHIQASMNDFSYDRSGNLDIMPVGKRPNSLLRWASINPREFDLPAGTSQQVQLSLRIPSGSDLSGEYAGMLFFQTRPVRRARAVAFSVRIGSKIYLTIPGTERIDGAVAKMSATSDGSGEQYRVLFKNTGNVHVYVNGQLEVQHDGATVDRIALESTSSVERGGERVLTASGKPLPAGKYQAIAMLDYGGKSMTGGEVAFEAH